MSQSNNHTGAQPANSPTIKSAAVTDRGLNERRPLNEDSFLADSDRGIFSVADGVGGAEAGEVASQTAIEVLDEAFRHQVDGADIEDLMELAIQRANASIHQMAQEHQKFSMMATTIVALHVDGNIATIGHVGDSRLYRLTPAGQLIRETHDHSVVEEEVRAGRMTAEQAANHPSKNVISRALGAEDDVEVDLKVIEVDDGTEFLLCTDGITRHIPDHELRQLLLTNEDLTTVCDELKRVCFERGAEDNLTAVMVRVGAAISAVARSEDLEKTISPETTPVPAADVVGSQTMLAANTPLVAPSRSAFPGSVEATAPAVVAAPTREIETAGGRLDVPAAARPRSGVERMMTRFFVLVLFLGALAAAFYAGRKYKGQIPYIDQNAASVTASPTPVVGDDPLLKFERGRREVDNDPNAWLGTQLPSELSRQGLTQPLESNDAEFLYLYGRASLLTGKTDDATRAFETAIAKANLAAPQANETLKKEAAIGLAAVALKSEKDRPAAQLRFDEMMRSGPTATPSASVASSPSLSP